MNIITVSREFGSGGRELGKRLADALQIAYYDREIITAIAEQCSLDETYIDRVMEHGAPGPYPVTFSRTLSHLPALMNQTTKLLVQQQKVIKGLAAKGDCVIIGRGADAILTDYRPLKLFVHAEPAAKIARCRGKACAGEALTDKELERKMKQIDKARESSHNFLASCPWGDKRGYHLCINTTGLEIKPLIAPIAAYARAWFERNHYEDTSV